MASLTTRVKVGMVSSGALAQVIVDKLRQYLESTGNLGMVDEGKMNAPIAVTPRKEDQGEDYDAPEKSETVVSVVLNALAKNFTDVWEAFTGES